MVKRFKLAVERFNIINITLRPVLLTEHMLAKVNHPVTQGPTSPKVESLDPGLKHYIFVYWLLCNEV